MVRKRKAKEKNFLLDSFKYFKDSVDWRVKDNAKCREFEVEQDVQVALSVAEMITR